jgi:hypothetical protein
MGSASASTALSSTSSTGWRSARRSIDCRLFDVDRGAVLQDRLAPADLLQRQLDRTIDELQPDLDAWIVEYNEQRPHQGRWCFGKTPMQTFLDALPLAKEKLMAA